MAVYLIGFALAVGMAAVAQKRRRLTYLALSCGAVLILCLIAGLRAQTVGTDVTVYVKPLTRAAIMADDLKHFFSMHWFRDWHTIYVSEFEYGFSLLVYVIAKVTKSLGAVLFVLQALTIVPIYIAFSRRRKTFPVWLGVLVYCLLCYPITLNAMRQWMAIGFLVLAMQMLLEKKWGITLLLSVIAFVFHYSAIMMVLIYFVYWLLQRSQKTVLIHQRLSVKGPTMVVILLFLVALLAIMNLQLIVKLMTMVGLGRFNNYLDGEPLSLEIGQILWKLPLVLLFLMNWKDMNRYSKTAPFFLTMLLMDIVSNQLVSVDVIALRIGFYFSAYSLLWIPELCACQKPGVKRGFTVTVIIGYCLFYWWYQFIFCGRNETYPYVFS